MIRIGEFDGRGRLGFGHELYKRGLLRTAVEIGTHRADFADAFLRNWPGMQLVCVDPWVAYDPTDPASVGDREADYRAAVKRLSHHGGRAAILRKMSQDAAGDFGARSLDFVYVDGNHQPESVMEDLEAWWPKLVSGGLLAGHDIICPAEPDGGWGKGIQPVVFAFAEREGVDVYLVPEPTSSPWSYFLVKP